MNAAEAHEVLERCGAVQRGHFRLSSGLHSDLYVQCALALQWPGIAERFGHELGARFADARPEVVVGPAMGGLVIAHEIARFCGVRMVFAERVEGRFALRRGFALADGERAIVAEDVVTTGGSQREALELVGRSGAEPVGVASIVDRSEGVSFGVRFEPMLQLRGELWAERDCPMCARGEALNAPGSRHVTR